MLFDRVKLGSRLAMTGTLMFALLASFGCATQNWTIDTIREMDRPLIDRMAKIEATAAAEKIRVDGQLNEIRASATLANQKADAETARLTRVLANRLKRNKVAEVSVFFQSGQADLAAADQANLQAVVKQLADNPTFTADVVGFTDKRGSAGDNVNLSWRREEAVRRFLVEKGADLNRLYFIGMGEELATGTTPPAEAKDRRGAVTIYSPAD